MWLIAVPCVVVKRSIVQPTKVALLLLVSQSYECQGTETEMQDIQMGFCDKE